MIFHSYQDYDYDKVCDKLESLRRFQGESFDNFLSRFKLVCLQFKSEDFPSEFELTGWFQYIVSLPCTSNTYFEQEDTITLNEFNVVSENVVASIDKKNVEIANKQTQENIDTIIFDPVILLSLNNYVKEDIQQSIFLIKNDNNNFPSNNMPLTIDSSNFSNYVHK
jgi:hypothetical protein